MISDVLHAVCVVMVVRGLKDRFFVCAGVGGAWLEVRCLKGYVAVKSLGTTALHS